MLLAKMLVLAICTMLACFRLCNKYDFLGLHHLVMEWRLVVEGQAVAVDTEAEQHADFKNRQGCWVQMPKEAISAVSPRSSVVVELGITAKQLYQPLLKIEVCDGSWLPCCMTVNCVFLL